MFRSFVFVMLYASLGNLCQAQVNITDSTINMSMLNICYRGLIPIGDLGDRFGFTSAVGFEVGHKLASNWYGQTGISFLFGAPVHEDTMLKGITTPGGIIINDNGQISEVRLSQAGFLIPFTIGKIIPIFPRHNPNSGLYLELGGQFLQHRIGISPTDQPVAALSKTYKKGYDRLTNGFGLRQGLGYKYFSNSGYFNFSVGFDVSQNFTQNRRTVNFDTGLKDDTQRLDVLAGVYVSWIFLIYNKAASSYYYR